MIVFNRFLLAALAVFSAVSSLFSQTRLGFEYDGSPVVKIGGQALKMPWAGGLNFVQVSDIDYDYDGDMDLFVFDRSGDQISLFEAETSGGTTTYRYLPNSYLFFPSDTRYRAAMLDYNQDGKNDLFTYGIGGVKVYKNVGSAATGLQWKLASNLLKSDYGHDLASLYVSSSDIPAYVDVEGDGDIDVLTFHVGGENLYYHQNQSMELYGVPDSLVFVVKNQCWGQFREDPTSYLLSLYDNQVPCGTAGGNVPDPQRPEHPPMVLDLPEGAFDDEPVTRHSGSTTLALDVNNDQVIDLVIGDVSYAGLTLLQNGGTAANTNSPMNFQDPNFPSNTTPVNLQLFPAAFYVDVNHDNVKDLIIGPNARNVSQNQKSVYYYENTGTNSLPNFLFRQKDFLQSEMIDHGLGSIPILFDQNGDGIRDLLVSNFFRFKDPADKECALMVYRNTGTTSAPEYSFLDNNFLNLTGQSLGLRTIPTFGDLDGDGDQDLLLGLEDGTINKYTNTAGAGHPVAFSGASPLTDNTGTAINVTDYAAPQLFDLDKDGLTDLIVGKKTGELSYYKNTGTTSSPEFTLINDTLGDADASTTTPDGYSIPHFFRVNDTTHLFLGAYDGRLHYYNNIDGNFDPDSSFTLVSAAYRSIDVGLYSSFWVEDIDNDGLLDLFVGQDMGGLNHLEENPNSHIGLTEFNMPSGWSLVPNPATNQVTLSRLEESPGETFEMTVYTILGEQIASGKIEGTSTLDISGYRKGVYLVTISSKDKREVLRLVKE